jgi:hypothetical protein
MVIHFLIGIFLCMQRAAWLCSQVQVTSTLICSGMRLARPRCQYPWWKNGRKPGWMVAQAVGAARVAAVEWPSWCKVDVVTADPSEQSSDPVLGHELLAAFWGQDFVHNFSSGQPGSRPRVALLVAQAVAKVLGHLPAHLLLRTSTSAARHELDQEEPCPCCPQACSASPHMSCTSNRRLESGLGAQRWGCDSDKSGGRGEDRQHTSFSTQNMASS